MSKRTLLGKKRAAVAASMSSQDSESDHTSTYATPHHACTHSGRGDFQILINALQTKFSRKAKDQQGQFEAQLRSVVEKTVEALGSKVATYEAHLYAALRSA